MALRTFFTHNEIVGVISNITPFQNFLLNFFGNEHRSNTKTIEFDKIAKDLRISTFQGYRTPAEVIPHRGFDIASLKPGYIKDKQTVDPDHVFVRRPGTSLVTPMTPSEIYAASVADISSNMVTRLYRRLELMAAQLFRSGSYSMIGEDVNVTVDFGRTAANGAAPSVLWTKANAATATPLQDIEDRFLILGAPCKTLLVGGKAWAAIKRDPKFDKLVYINTQVRDQMNSLVFGPVQRKEGAEFELIYRGTLGNANIFTYTGTYEDPDTGTETLFIGDSEVVFLPDAGYGWQCFAPIMDSEADFAPLPYFIKNWEEKDPSLPYVMLQSAPLLAHTKINATGYMNTGAD